MKSAIAMGLAKLKVPLAVAAGGLLPMVLAPSASGAPPAPANGQALYKAQCVMCHSTVAGKKGVGPSLAGIANRKAGSVTGFAYSPAIKKSNLKWDKATLDRYLADPRKTVPGTKMVYAGQKDAAKRSALVAYLLTLR